MHYGDDLIQLYHKKLCYEKDFRCNCGSNDYYIYWL